MPADIINYKCPNCSAPMVFGIESQKWECHFCFSNFTKEELSKIEANTGAAIEESDWVAEQFDSNDVVTYSCPDCGGRVITQPNTVATFCVYCHNPTIIAGRISGEYRPAKIIPFKLTKENAIVALKKLGKGKPFLPKNFKEIIDNGEVEGLYVPYWLFSTELNASATAIGKKITTWSDYNYRYTKTDTYNINRFAKFPYTNIPVDGSTRMDDTLMESIEPYAHTEMQDFSPQYLSGHFAENFDVDAEACAKRFRSRTDENARAVMRSFIKGYNTISITSFNTNSVGENCIYAMYPVWLVSAKHKDKIYNYAINGQSGVSAGKLPVSAGRVVAWSAGLFAAMALIFTILGGFFG